MNKDVSASIKYREILSQLKLQIRSSRAKAALVVNSSLIQLYWNTGKMIAENQALFEGRNSYVDQLAKDLQSEFPGMKGFSKRNIFYCRKFYIFYSTNSVQQGAALNPPPKDESPMQQAAAPDQSQLGLLPIGSSLELFTIPWGHQMLLLDKTNTLDEAQFYVRQIIENNWSRAILSLQIEENLFGRHGKAITNFTTTLPEHQAQMATQILKDPYNFGFLTMEPKAQELDIEKQLTEQITKFLLELGKGFAFLGRQYPIEVGQKDYRLDLLFYHIRLKCFIVIDLKAVEFQPEFAGKMNFYLSAVDDLLKAETDQPSIGIILCKNKNKLEVEYALRGMNKPIGVSEFSLTRALPAALKSTLPTIEEFEKRFDKSVK